MGEVKFDSANPFYNSRYASLGAVIEASKKALSNNGLSVSQPTVSNEYGVGISTLLLHESGEWIESTVTIPVTDGKNIAQEAGKTITYLRRYSLASILNLYSDEDTDGEQKVPQKQPAPQKMSIETAANIKGSDGKKYGDCSDQELKNKLIGISKVLNNKNVSPEDKEGMLFKRDAINTILAARKK